MAIVAATVLTVLIVIRAQGRNSWFSTINWELQDDIFEAFSEYGDIKNLRGAPVELFGARRGGGSPKKLGFGVRPRLGIGFRV